MPVVLIYAAVALAGLIVSGVIASNILSHLDGTASSNAYSASVLQREKTYLEMHKAGVSDAEINRQLGPAPKQPKSMTGGLSMLLIAGGVGVAALAIFWKPLLGMFAGRKAA